MSFDRVARWFGPLERLAFGQGMQRARESATNLLRAEEQSVRRALFVGDGDGRGALAFAQTRPAAELWLVDASHVFLDRARARLDAAGVEASYVHADVLTDELPDGPFDLIATHFLLDCFESPELGQVIASLTAVAARDARWIVSDFYVPESGAHHFLARAWLSLLYPFFRATARLQAERLEDPAPALGTNGWTRAEADVEQGLWRSSLFRRETAGDLRAPQGTST